MSRSSDRSDCLTESDVRGYCLEESVERPDMSRVENERLAHEVLVAVAKESNLPRVSGRHEGHRRR